MLKSPIFAALMTNPSFLARITAWLRTNPFSALVAVAVLGYVFVRFGFSGYMAQTEWVTEPIYNPFVKDWVFLHGKLAEVPAYTYALVARAVPLSPQLSVWPAVVYGVGVLLCFSLMVACLSFLQKEGTANAIRFWLAATVVVAASAFLVNDGPVGSTQMGTALRGVAIVVNAGLLYAFSQLWPRVRLGQRFAAIGVGNLAWFASLYFLGEGWPAYTLWAGYATPLLTGIAALFAFQAAYFLPYGALLLAVRQNLNGLLAYGMILLFCVGNVYVSYMSSRGLEGYTSIWTINSVWILAALAMFGLEPYERFVAEDSNWFTVPALAKPLYAAWGGLTFCLIAWAQGTENGPLSEVMEDVTNFSLIGVSAGFLIYVLANFAGPLWESAPVDRILFQPYRLPFGGIMAVAATVIYMMYQARHTVQYYKTLAAENNAVADGFFLKRDYQSADLFYQEAQAADNYNFHSNYMLAQLAKARGSDEAVDLYLKQAVAYKARPEGYLEMAERNRGTAFMQQLFTLIEARNKFPDDERIQNNLLETYLNSDVRDSVVVLARQLAGSRIEAVQTTVLAASALGRLPEGMKLPSGGPLANRYWGEHPRPDACQLAKSALDTADMGSMASFLGLFNGALLCNNGEAPPVRLDTLITNVRTGFQEDLLYARAWMLWNSGKRLQALEDMLTLAHEESPSAATFVTTAIAWAEELQHSTSMQPSSIAVKLYGERLAKIDSAYNPSMIPDPHWREMPFAACPEENRAAWLLAGPNPFTAEQAAELLRDFTNPLAQRMFLLAASRQVDNEVLLARGIPKLLPAKTDATKAIDHQLSWIAFSAGVKGVQQNIPPFFSRLDAAMKRLNDGKTEASDFALLGQAFPYSTKILGILEEHAKANSTWDQAFFDAITPAYALDHSYAATRNAYIRTARRLNLDSFAESAEAEFKDMPSK